MKLVGFRKFLEYLSNRYENYVKKPILDDSEDTLSLELGDDTIKYLG